MLKSNPEDKLPSVRPLISRRKLLTKGGLIAAGGILVGNSAVFAKATKPETIEPPSLPWPWVKLDPQEAGERTFRNYHEKGG